MGFKVKLSGFNAIDRYLGKPELAFFRVDTNADITDLAKAADELRFPGPDIADGAVDTKTGTCYFFCHDFNRSSSVIFPFLSFSWDFQNKRFYDPAGIYPLLLTLKKCSVNIKKTGVDKTLSLSIAEEKIPDWNSLINFSGSTDFNLSLLNAALVLSRYDFGDELFKIILKIFLSNTGVKTFPQPEIQRVFLCSILVSPRPDLGLEFLRRTGFLKDVWP